MKSVVYEQPPVPEINALKHELQLFVNAVNNNTEPVVNGESGLKALKVAQIIIQKIQETKLN